MLLQRSANDESSECLRHLRARKHSKNSNPHDGRIGVCLLKLAIRARHVRALAGGRVGRRTLLGNSRRLDYEVLPLLVSALLQRKVVAI
jgi:hypothetical protein